MKKLFLLLLFTSSYLFSFSQASNSEVGWYHLLPGSKTKILVSYDKASDYSTSIKYATDEVLMIFETHNKIGYAIDVDGRIVAINSMYTVKKIDMPGRVVKMTKDVDISLNKKLGADNNVWLIGYNSASNTAKILLGNGDIAEIPQNSFVELRAYFQSLGQQNSFYNVTDQ